MKKTLPFVLLGLAVCVIFLWVIGRLTSTLQFYSIPTTSNYPTIKQGSYLFASNLKTPERFDFICYYFTTPENVKEVHVHRLCGMENDIIEIRNGDLYVNNEAVDAKLSVANEWSMTYPEYDKLQLIEEVDEYNGYGTKDSITLYVSNELITSGRIKAARRIYPASTINEGVQERYKNPWNTDHFGPVKVPKNKYFVLGDNRHYSQDSRYTGFIDKSDYVGTVLGK